MRGGPVVRLFVLAKDGRGLRMIGVHFDIDAAADEVRRFEQAGWTTTTVAGFDLSDVMQSHPAWFEIKGDS